MTVEEETKDSRVTDVVTELYKMHKGLYIKHNKLEVHNENTCGDLTNEGLQSPTQSAPIKEFLCPVSD